MGPGRRLVVHCSCTFCTVLRADLLHSRVCTPHKALLKHREKERGAGTHNWEKCVYMQSSIKIQCIPMVVNLLWYCSSMKICMCEKFVILQLISVAIWIFLRFYSCNHTHTWLAHERQATTFCVLIFATTSLLAKFANKVHAKICWTAVSDMNNTCIIYYTSMECHSLGHICLSVHCLLPLRSWWHIAAGWSYTRRQPGEVEFSPLGSEPVQLQ